MIRKYGLNLLALVIAIAGVAFKTPAKNESPKSDFYYAFTGNHGEENQMSKWSQLSTLTDYNALSCPSGSAKGCKIINITNSGGHPTSVPLSGGLPTAVAPNSAVANRN